MSGENRCLRKLEYRPPPVDVSRLVPDEDWPDPEKPVEFDRIFDRFVHAESGESGEFHWLKIAAVKNPDWRNLAIAAAVPLALATAGWLTQKRLRNR